MGAVESNEADTPTDMAKRVSIEKEEIVKPPENIAQNKIISLLGLDDHEKYFESTDSEISELNDDKKKTGEILYFHETAFKSNSTLKPNDYCMRKCCGAPRVGDFIKICDSIGEPRVKPGNCETDCPSKLSNKNKIECNAPPPKTSFPCKPACYNNKKSQPCNKLSSRCNTNTCPNWDKLQTKCPNSSKQINMKQSSCVKNINSRDVDKITPTCNNMGKNCKAHLKCLNDNTNDIIPPPPPPKTTHCFEPDTCRRLKHKSINLQDIDSRKEALPTQSKSAPQQNVNCKTVSKNKPPLEYSVPLPNLPKKMQDTGTNTSIIEERRVPCDTPKKQSQKNVTEKPHSCNHNKKNKASDNGKCSTSCTYDDQTTPSTGYSNYESETCNTTYSSDYDQNRPCHCQCMHCQYEYQLHHGTAEHLQEVTSASITDELCSNFSDRSNKNEYMHLAYQKVGEYPVLVNELESTLSHRNKTRVQKTMQQFEMLSNNKNNNQLKKTPHKDDECNYYKYDSKYYEQEYCCHKCQKVLQKQQTNFQCSTSKAPLKKYTTNQQNGKIGENPNKFMSQNDSRNKHFNSNLSPRLGYVEKTANYMNQQLNYKIAGYPKGYGIKQIGWKVNSHTGDWERDNEMETYGYEWDESPTKNPPASPKNKLSCLPEEKTITNMNASTCICQSCQYRQ